MSTPAKKPQSAPVVPNLTDADIEAIVKAVDDEVRADEERLRKSQGDGKGKLKKDNPEDDGREDDDAPGSGDGVPPEGSAGAEDSAGAGGGPPGAEGAPAASGGEGEEGGEGGGPASEEELQQLFGQMELDQLLPYYRAIKMAIAAKQGAGGAPGGPGDAGAGGPPAMGGGGAPGAQPAMPTDKKEMPSSPGNGGRVSTQKSETGNAELKKTVTDLSAKIDNLTKTLSVPQRRAITGDDYRQPAGNSGKVLNKAEATAVLNKKIPSMTTDNRRRAMSFTLGNIGLDDIQDLLE